jgi:hypothetical protein
VCNFGDRPRSCDDVLEEGEKEVLECSF